MKTLTITLHDTDNCGSSLQTYGLQHFLLKNNIENQVIDYTPAYTKNNGNKIKTFIRKLVFYKDSKIREKKFKDFTNKYIKKTPENYTNFKQLEKECPKADCYITGSDQLWNSMYQCGQDPAFYLKFVNGAKKIAYAVSLGREKIPQDNLELVKKYASNFKWVSVREKTSVPQIKSLFSQIEIDYVCDPVLLNEAKDYDDIKGKRIIKEDYILVYMAQIPDSEYMNKIIRKVQSKFDGKVVLIGSYRNRCKCDYQIRDVAPPEFLSLIYNANYIISNSFHATMFSLIYNKQFLSVLPQENGARIQEILKYCKIENHAIKMFDEIKNVPVINNYTNVNNKLNEFRKFSQKKLLSNLLEKNE